MEWKEIENTTVKPGDDGTDGFFQCKQEKKKKKKHFGRSRTAPPLYSHSSCCLEEEGV